MYWIYLKRRKDAVIVDTIGPFLNFSAAKMSAADCNVVESGPTLLYTDIIYSPNKN